MAQFSQFSFVGEKHHNQGLFSDYFLDNILPGEEPWLQAWLEAMPEAEKVLQQLQNIKKHFTPSANEAQTEEDWIKPVLTALGHTYEVQATLKTPDGTKRPDYIFYLDEEARTANKNVLLSEDLFRQQKRAFAVGDAKQWNRPLDQTLQGNARGNDPFTNKNPSYQIFFYMLHSGLPWGILTNGRKWRLYHEQSAHKLEVFYEVDLPELVDSGDVSAFMYFYLFFRRQAFEPGPLSLERLLQASTDYALGISESLRQQVYDALRYVAQGFLEYPDNRFEHTPETYKEIYDNSLILLYRLLFILYAEARGLLPLQDNRRYSRKYSLNVIKRDVVRELTDNLLIPSTGIYWTRLKVLFSSINTGSPLLSVATFNGGLFDPKHHAFLERYVVGDVSLCRAIDKLTRVNQQFIDYRDLAERHLGTIYEGLLEYRLEVAQEPMVELRSSSKIVPEREAPRKEIVNTFDTGEVYLVTDRGERKVTGSYYTPDYIVKYMVDETLRPLLNAALAAAQTDAERIQAVLSINVLDPSMGSGHFPVEVTNYLARYLVELGVQAEETGEADLTYWKRRVVQQCIYGVDLNPLAVELAKLSLWLNTAAKNRPLNFLDHHLRSGNALIGSWLEEIAAGQHPRLVRKQKRGEQEPVSKTDVEQLSMLADSEFRASMQSALVSLEAIEQNPGITIKDVKAQESAYAELRRRFSEKYLALADLGASLYYELGVSNDLWRPLRDYTVGRSAEGYQPDAFRSWLEQSERLARSKRFFHWELEFPDVFFDHNGESLGEQAGFDVIIGNPPYVRQEQLGPDKPYFRENYGDVYHGVADLFVYFFAQGLHLLKQGGRLAYISSNMWLRTNYATPLRRYLRTHTTIEQIIDLGNTRVFPDAPDLSPSIQILSKAVAGNEHLARVAIFKRTEQVENFRELLADRLFPLSIHDQLDSGWQMTGDAPRQLFAKLMVTGKPLGETVERRMYRGVLTGLNEAFIIDQATRDQLVKDDPNCASLLKPMLRGEDLRPWYQENEGRWLICLPSGWTMRTFSGIERDEAVAWQHFSQRYPSVSAYLEPHAEAARKRQDQGQFWWELRPCDYYDAFELPKIFWPDIARFPRFSYDEKGQFVNNKGYILPRNDHSLLGVLQSRVCWFCISRLCAPLGERAGLLIYQHFTQFITNIPIPDLDEGQRETIGNLAEQLTEVARRRYDVRHKMTNRIVKDLGHVERKATQRLLEWWQLSFQDFRAEIHKSFKRDIPLKERDDWEDLLQVRAAEITRLTDEIIRLETELNAAVYAAFGLNADEIAIIEDETKYAYGEW